MNPMDTLSVEHGTAMAGPVGIVHWPMGDAGFMGARARAQGLLKGSSARGKQTGGMAGTRRKRGRPAGRFKQF